MRAQLELPPIKPKTEKYRSHRLHSRGGKGYGEYQFDRVESIKRIIAKYGVGVTRDGRPLRVNGIATLEIREVVF